MKALVTGADGFVGRWLVRELEAAGDEVWQACGLNPQPGARCRRVDVTDPDAVAAIVSEAAPNAIYHLAAVAFGPSVTDHMAAASSVTIVGTVNVLEAARSQHLQPMVWFQARRRCIATVTTKSLMKACRSSRPLCTEQRKQRKDWWRAHVSPSRPRASCAQPHFFNHIRPGQNRSFVVSAFAGQLADTVRGTRSNVITVGNLDAERDFTDVRDVVRAYRLLVEGNHVGPPFMWRAAVRFQLAQFWSSSLRLAGRRSRLKLTEPCSDRSTSPESSGTPDC